LNLSHSSWGAEELQAIETVMYSGLYTMGAKVSEFEKAYADYCGSKYCVMVNSGSSANLLMVAAYTLRYGPGIVAVPALGWSTSYTPFQQYGWKLRFVDIDRETLNYDLEKLWQANEKDDLDLCLAINVLGNPNEFKGFPRRVRVLEDNCESMGAEYGNKRTGTFGVMSSHSTFFSHHICTMEGGMVTTDDEYFYHMLLSLRSHGWTRHLPEENALGEKVENWRFILPGYNVRPIEMMGAVGLEQLKKLPEIVRQRRKNAETFPLPTQREIGKSSWYGFALLSDDIDALKAGLISKGIEHRPVISGNFTRHQVIKYFDCEIPDLPNADYVHDHGVMIGNHPTPIDWKALAQPMPV
jgi:CDP-6-deoxy-D-xylo-4-hexulose-3-dehydrase